MSKSQELVVVDEARLKELREESGAREGGAIWPAKLRVNRKILDEDENRMPLGKYIIKHNNKDHFLDSAEFIAMEKRTQFIRFSGKTYVGCTMLEDTFNAKYLDSLGGERLGRVAGQAKEDMTQAQQEAKFNFHILGILDISKATDAEGNKLYDQKEAMWIPAALQFTGRKSKTKQDELRKLKKKGEAYFDFITVLSKPFKQGKATDGSPFYDFNLERGDDVVITEEILDSIEAVKSIVENENRRIYKKHLEGQQANAIESEEDSYTDLELPQDDDA